MIWHFIAVISFLIQIFERIKYRHGIEILIRLNCARCACGFFKWCYYYSATFHWYCEGGNASFLFYTIQMLVHWDYRAKKNFCIEYRVTIFICMQLKLGLNQTKKLGKRIPNKVSAQMVYLYAHSFRAQLKHTFAAFRLIQPNRCAIVRSTRAMRCKIRYCRQKSLKCSCISFISSIIHKSIVNQ